MANKLSLQVTLSAVDSLSAPLRAALKASQFLNTEINQLRNNFRSISGEGSSAASSLQSLAANEQAATTHINATNQALVSQSHALQQLRNTPPPLIPDAYRQQFAANRDKRAQLMQEAQGLVAIGKAFEAPLEEAQKYQTMTEKFNQFGMGDAALADAEKFTKAKKVFATSQLEMMTYFTEAQGIFRESGAHTTEEALKEAKMAAPIIAKVQAASQGLDENGQKMSHDMTMEMLRAVEQAGGISSAKQFNNLIEGGFKAVQSSGGAVDWSQYRQLFSKGGSAATNLDPKVLFAKLEPFIGDMKGGQVGEALATTYRRTNGLTKDLAAGQRFIDMGLWNKNAVEFNDQGQVSKLIKGKQALKKEWADLAAHDPVEFYLKAIVPKYKEMYGANLKQSDVNRENNLLFGRQGAKLFDQIYKNQHKIEASVASFDKARSLDGAYQAIQETYAGKKMALEAKWKNFELALGKDSGLLDLATKGLEKLGGALDVVTGYTEKFPNLTHEILLLGLALIGLKAAMIIGGGMSTLISDVMLLGGLLINFFTPSVMAANLAALRFKVSSRSVAAAMWLWNTAMLANPIGLIIIAVAALAFTIYKYWEPIKAFTLGMWDGLSTGLAPLAPYFEGIKAKAMALFDYFAPSISSAIDWFTQLFTPIHSTKAELEAAGASGRNFGLWLADGIKIGVAYMDSLPNKWATLVADMVDAGRNLMNGLANGISQGWQAVSKLMSGMAESIKISFKDALGIHSPSKVFEEFGININQGLGVGLQQQKIPLTATSDLAKAVTDTFTKANPKFKVQAEAAGSTGSGGGGGASHAMAYFMKQGWTKEQAAGLAANLHRESQFKANAVGDGGKAYGIGQWHPDRQALFAKQFGHSIKGSSLDEQLQFVQWELNHNEKRAGSKLKSAQSAREAGAVVSKFYERPAKREAEAAGRGAHAAQLAMKGIDVASLAGLPDASTKEHLSTVKNSAAEVEQSPSASASAFSGAGASGGGATYHQTITIEVHGSEGMSAKQLAAAVKQEFRERTSKSGQMFDGAY